MLRDRPIYLDFGDIDPESGYIYALCPDWLRSSDLKTPDTVIIEDSGIRGKATIQGFGSRGVYLRVIGATV